MTSHANLKFLLFGQLGAQTWCLQQRQPQRQVSDSNLQPWKYTLSTQPCNNPVWFWEHPLLFLVSLKTMLTKALWSGPANSRDIVFQTATDLPGKPAPEPGGAVKLSKKLPSFTTLETTPHHKTSSRIFLITNTFWQQAGWEGLAHPSSRASIIRILPRTKLDLQREMDHLEGWLCN